MTRANFLILINYLTDPMNDERWQADEGNGDGGNGGSSGGSSGGGQGGPPPNGD